MAHRIFIYLFILLLSPFVSAKLIPIEEFAKHPKYTTAVISPTGEYLAVGILDEDGEGSLAVLELASNQWLSNVKFDDRHRPYDIVWVNDTRVLAKKGKKKPNSRTFWAHGGFFAMDIDGKKQKLLMYDRTIRIGDGRILDRMPEDDRTVLVEFDTWYQRNDVPQHRGKKDAFLLDVYNGKTKHVIKAPMKHGNFVIDENGQIVLSTGSDVVDGKWHYYVHLREGDDWKQISERESESDYYFYPLSVQDGGKFLIAEEGVAGGPNVINKIKVDTWEKELLYQNKLVSPETVFVDKDTREVFGVFAEEHFPSVAIFNPDHPIGKWYPYLQKKLGDQRIQILGSSDDNKVLNIRTEADVNPGIYYLFNTETEKLTQLFKTHPTIDINQLSPMSPFEFTNRDGVKVTGYFTAPQGKVGDVPLVVMPHGGPHGPRDYWEYSGDIQALASRGYAVLQVNFQGSGGFGNDFEVAGYKEWGRKIQHDIIDATRWALKKGYADKDRVCIFGASFGGYSALMSSIIEPELFKCAIGYVGVYDMNLMWDKGDIGEQDWGEDFLNKVLGTDKETLNAFSPVLHVDKLKAPVFLIHGKKDKRAHVEHYYVMKEALEKKKHPLKTMLKSGEGHGFFKQKNRVQLLKEVIKFLDKHIGK